MQIQKKKSRRDLTDKNLNQSYRRKKKKKMHGDHEEKIRKDTYIKSYSSIYGQIAVGEEVLLGCIDHNVCFNDLLLATCWDCLQC